MMITLYISIGILSNVTILVFVLLRYLNKSIETLTFMIGKFAEINQDIYLKQKHINKILGENIEKQNKQVASMGVLRREMDGTKTKLEDTSSNTNKTFNDITSTLKKYINTLESKQNKIKKKQ